MKITTRSLFARLAVGVAALAFAQAGYAEAAQAAQAAPAQAQGAAKPSKQAFKALSELQAAVNSKDPAAIQAKAAAAQAVVSTKDDQYILAQLQLQAAVAANDYAAMSSAINAISASGYVDATKTSQLYLALGSALYRAKQLDQAANAFERAIAINPANADAIVDLGETRFSQGRKAEAVSAFQRAIQVKLTGGQKPEQALYKRALAIAYDGNLPQTADIAREFVAAYPGPDSWRISLGVYRSVARLDIDSTLDLLRLLRTANAMTDPTELALYLNVLKDQSNFIEGQAAIDKARQSNQFDASSAQLSQVAKELSAKPKVTADDLAAAAKSAPTGVGLLHIGDRFYGLGEFAKAVDTYRQAKAKGVDANLVNERVGVALAAAGDKAGAIAALKSVTGPRSGVAQFWLLFLQNQG